MAATPVPALESDSVPLVVWPCAQTSAQYQRAGRYLPASTQHPGKMLPELARRIVAAYSLPGDLVVDPMCGIGTTLIEGAALGRRCVGVELEARWAALADANLNHIMTGEQRPLAEVRLGDARHLPETLGERVGTVDLIVTSPPYACEAGRIDKSGWLAGGSICDADGLNYSTDRTNLGHARGHAYATAMAEVYGACFAALRPGGRLVTVTKNMRRHGQLLDLAATTRRLASDSGFDYLQHVVALLARIRDSGLAARPSFWQLTQTRKARAKGAPLHLVVHEDVLVFAKPQEVAHG